MRREFCLNRGYDFRFNTVNGRKEILGENPNWKKNHVRENSLYFQGYSGIQ